MIRAPLPLRSGMPSSPLDDLADSDPAGSAQPWRMASIDD